MIRPVLSLLLCAAVLLGLSGCASKEALPSYYVLTPAASAGKVFPSGQGTRIFIRRVTLPGYLDTTKLVSRRSDNQIEYSPTALWAEPLGEGIGRAVADALSRRPGVGAVSAPPLGIPPPRDYDLKIDIERCEGDAKGQVVLTARWELFRPESGTPILTRGGEFTQPGWTYGDTAAQARLLGLNVQELGEQIAKSIRR